MVDFTSQSVTFARFDQHGAGRALPRRYRSLDLLSDRRLDLRRGPVQPGRDVQITVGRKWQLGLARSRRDMFRGDGARVSEAAATSHRETARKTFWARDQNIASEIYPLKRTRRVKLEKAVPALRSELGIVRCSGLRPHRFVAAKVCSLQAFLADACAREGAQALLCRVRGWQQRWPYQLGLGGRRRGDKAAELREVFAALGQRDSG